jgi:CYTH domain-containing protein
MPIEYEHRYLVESIPEWKDFAQIKQRYIGIDSDRSFIQRVRMICSDEHTPIYLATHKLGRDPFVHEVEYEIPPDAYHELCDYFTIGTPIDKVRYHVYIDGLKWDVDKFANGMIIAELEDPPEEYSLDGFGESINLSEMSEFKNFKISLNGYPEYKHLFEGHCSS